MRSLRGSLVGLPRDLREVYWNDPRRQAVRAFCLVDFASAPTTHFGVPGEDRLAPVPGVTRAIPGQPAAFYRHAA